MQTRIASDFLYVFSSISFPRKWSSSTMDFNFCSTEIHVNAEESHPWHMQGTSQSLEHYGHAALLPREWCWLGAGCRRSPCCPWRTSGCGPHVTATDIIIIIIIIIYYLLKALHSPVNRTGSPQGFSLHQIFTQVEYSTKHAHLTNCKTFKHNLKVSPFGIALIENGK